MYEWITYTWNTVKGECPHNCSYCYMKRRGKLNPVRFDESELKTDLGNGNFIFVGSSCDMFAGGIPHEWIQRTLNHCSKFDNQYLFQTKNTFRLEGNGLIFPDGSVYCTTIETNRFYKDIMGNCPKPSDRAYHLPSASYVTIEPIIDFDLNDMVALIGLCNPIQVNIGADSGNNGLPEPPKEKILALIDALGKFTIVKKKTNLKRLLS